MPGRFAGLPLRRQLFVAIFLLLVPLLAAVIWSGSMSFQERGDELGDEARTIARTVAAVIDRDPQYAHAYAMAARELAHFGRLDEAKAALERAHALDPEMLDHWDELRELFETLKRR